MKLAAICLGRPEILQSKSYKTGINKIPVNAPTLVDRAGLVGDSVCNRKHHGGPDQAILLEGELTITWWSRHLGRELPSGTFGENRRIDALDGRDVCIGDRFVFAEVVLQATAPRIPCATFAARMGEHDFVRRYSAAGRPGIYCRALREGVLEPGEAVRFEPYEGDRVPVADLLPRAGERINPPDQSRLMALPIAERLRKRYSTV
ncbi:MOSC domain-containing protein [Pseudorhizobium halotolerans]|uniref:MOSC domain-containing protein n=1 Tax=Pseudorhizobium halotolerans TaxID=1233081 RepID=A0ABN7JUF7_9HYPH|nr:MOSC domain-containing protein [Pseudorhizobium halotolerans]CAD7048852.1 MOSC domain-containing protein [Pseudorhizobium halotolerans]